MPRDIAVLVRAYRAKNAPWLDEQIRYYAGLPLDEAIVNAALAKKPDGSKHQHQQRRKSSTLEAAAQVLLASRDRMQKCDTFETLHDLICELTQGIKDFGALARYDTTFRIGANLSRFPVLVFLHAGTVTGYKALGLKYRNDAVQMNVFPPELQALKPCEVEDFLCIYKHELRP
jgi:hypothetical protein